MNWRAFGFGVMGGVIVGLTLTVVGLKIELHQSDRLIAAQEANIEMMEFAQMRCKDTLEQYSQTLDRCIAITKANVESLHAISSEIKGFHPER